MAVVILKSIFHPKAADRKVVLRQWPKRTACCESDAGQYYAILLMMGLQGVCWNDGGRVCLSAAVILMETVSFDRISQYL